MSERASRTLRTLLQAALGAIGAGGIRVLFPTLDDSLIAVIAVTLTTVITNIQNFIEEAQGKRLFQPKPILVAEQAVEARILDEGDD